MLLRKSRKSRLEETVDQARQQAGDWAERVVDDYLPAASGAVAGVMAGAREAVPVVQDAAADATERARRNYHDLVRPAAQQAYEHTRDVRVPAAREALTEAGRSAREMAQERAAEAQDHLPGRQKKSGRGKKLLAGLAVLGVGAGVARFLMGRQQQRTLPYVPPTPTPRTSTPEAAATGGAASAAAATAAGQSGDASDAGGSGPGEALSDEHEGPHPVTTPDAPAESEVLDDPRS